MNLKKLIMKKIILLAAFGVAGLVNAKSTVASNLYSKVTEIKEEEKENKVKAFGCMQVFVQKHLADLIHTQHGVANGEPSV